MRKIGRYRKKKQKKILIIGSLSLLLFLCIGYAAFSTNLSITAKGNIKEKNYKVEDLKTLVVTSGDGLYIDEYENGRYDYRGDNPNNYIWFNDEMWRIISIESDNTLKIIKNESIGKIAFDSTNARTTGYCYSSEDKGSDPLNGCNAWSATNNMVGSPAEFSNGYYSGVVDKDSEMLTYLNGTYLSQIKANYSTYIVNHNFNIGAVERGSTNLLEQINNEKQYMWNGKIGLISASDYIRSIVDQNACGTFLKITTSFIKCNYSSWIYNIVLSVGNLWTISPARSDTQEKKNDVITIPFDIIGISKGAAGLSNVFPTLFLNSNIVLSGLGTESNPYKIIS